MFQLIEDIEDGVIGIFGPEDATKEDYVKTFPEIEGRILRGNLYPNRVMFIFPNSLC